MVGFRSSNYIISILFISEPLSYHFFYLNLILSHGFNIQGEGYPEGKQVSFSESLYLLSVSISIPTPPLFLTTLLSPSPTISVYEKKDWSALFQSHAHSLPNHSFSSGTVLWWASLSKKANSCVSETSVDDQCCISGMIISPGGYDSIKKRC